MDTISPEKRSANMRNIRSANTAPEMAVRRLLHSTGYRYRLRPKELPGRPDLVFPSRRTVVFVHGCFWHQHPLPGCPIVRQPKSNERYWRGKLAHNRKRDEMHEAQLRLMGWKVATVWECEIERDLDKVGEYLRGFLQ